MISNSPVSLSPSTEAVSATNLSTNIGSLADFGKDNDAEVTQAVVTRQTPIIAERNPETTLSTNVGSSENSSKDDNNEGVKKGGPIQPQTVDETNTVQTGATTVKSSSGANAGKDYHEPDTKGTPSVKNKTALQKSIEDLEKELQDLEKQYDDYEKDVDYKEKPSQEKVQEENHTTGGPVVRGQTFAVAETNSAQTGTIVLTNSPSTSSDKDNDEGMREAGTGLTSTFTETSFVPMGTATVTNVIGANAGEDYKESGTKGNTIATGTTVTGTTATEARLAKGYRHFNNKIGRF